VLGVTPLPSGGGYAASLIYSRLVNPVTAGGTNATATFDANGQMTSISGLSGGEYFTLGAGGTHADFGSDGILLAWGRWIGPVTGGCGASCALDEDYDAKRGFHYVVGMPTASMPQTGTARYELIGATRPTHLDGIPSPGTVSGTLSVDFGALAVGMNLNVGIDGKGYAVGGNAGISGSTFSSNISTNLPPVTATGTSAGACTSGCSAGVDGFFAGTNAARAGLAYQIIDSNHATNTLGAAAFAKL
jgi:hypothetical protein